MNPRLLLLAALLLLPACGPRLAAEAIAGRTVMVRNEEAHDVTIERLVANHDEARAECTDSPGAVLGPGRTYTTTFFYCDEVKTLRVDTDAGATTLNLD